MKKSTQLPGKYPCPRHECRSSDAVRKYADGSAFCFSCQHPLKNGEVAEEPKQEVSNFSYKDTIEKILTYPFSGIMSRGISEEVAKFFEIRVKRNTSGKTLAHYYPYPDGAFKRRLVDTKDFLMIGSSGSPKELFGQDKFSGGGKRLIITEGELDTASIGQAYMDKYGKIYPVVSVPSATILKPLIEKREWIRSFQEVIICFDEDSAGREAAEKACKIIGFDKVKRTRLSEKDANDVLMKHGKLALLEHIWDAGRIIPKGIMNKDTLWEALVNHQEIKSVPYPPCIRHLNDKLKGMRPHEISLFISGTSCGKSTLMREIMLHVLETTDQSIGVLSLEESPPETARLLAGMKLHRNPANEEIPISELKTGFDAVFGDDRVIVLDHQYQVNDTSLMDKLEYMCLNGVSYLFIDHITILTSEGVEDLTGNEAQDKIMNTLLRLVKKYPVWIGLVSHLRKASFGGKSFEEGRMPSLDDIKGSGSIKQVSFDVVGFARNLTAANERERNTIGISVLKCRYTGLTGPVQGAYYVFETGRLSVLDGHAINEYVAVN
jgi:twinkle protein